jgi:hypothetical protein
MDRTEEMKHAEAFYNSCLKTLKVKAHDYAQDTDCFSNFKKIALVCNVPIEKVFLQFITVKIARIAELVEKGKTEVGESISDSLKDMSNYSCLFDVYLKEVNNDR